MKLINEEQLNSLLDVLESTQHAGSNHVSNIRQYLRESLPVFYLYKLKNSNNYRVREYATATAKAALVVSPDTLEQRVSKILRLSLEDLASFSSPSSGEIEIYNTNYQKLINFDSSSCADVENLLTDLGSDDVEFIELLRANLPMALTSNIPYIRGFAEAISQNAFTISPE